MKYIATEKVQSYTTEYDGYSDEYSIIRSGYIEKYNTISVELSDNEKVWLNSLEFIYLEQFKQFFIPKSI